MDRTYGPDTSSVPMRVPGWRVVALREREGRYHFELPLEPRRWSLGSDDRCDLVVDDPYVSREHCVLVRDRDHGLILQDRESKNGTRVDGTPTICARLLPGAHLVIGRTQLVAVGDHEDAGTLPLIKGNAPALRSAVDAAVHAARSDTSVLIVGETGTGKDLIARAIHERSRRAGGPFVAINCGSFSREMIAGQLFGHVRGSFTGAHEDRDGVFVQADGGTLFLDELAELPLEQQSHLLRAIESRRVRPIGASAERAVDVRFVAATNRLDELGTPASPLRLDLYHRVAGVKIALPPLRERPGDVLELARSFVVDLAPRFGYRELMPAALEALAAHDWPGNVRELRQCIERAVTLGGSRIDVGDLGLARGSRQIPCAVPEPIGGGDAASPLAAAMRALIVDALEQGGSIRAAAEYLGMPKSTLAQRVRDLGIEWPRRRAR